MKILSHCLALFVLALLPTLPTRAQVPNQLLYAISPPPAGAQAGSWLGTSVAVDGPYAVVGAPGDDSGAEDGGLVKVFDAATGALLFVLPNPDPQTADYFGDSVAISGTRIVVGSFSDNVSGVASGSAYVFDLASATPAVPVLKLTNPAPLAGDFFGSAVAIMGNRVAVGSSGKLVTHTFAGSVFLYDLGGVAPATPVLTIPNPVAVQGGDFGSAVALSGNLLAIGSPNDTTAGNQAGAVYIYDLGGATPANAVWTVLKPNPQPVDTFGEVLAMAGTKLVVGVRADRGYAGGGAYVYDLGGVTPTAAVFSLHSPGFSSGAFGRSVGISGSRVVVGADHDYTGTVPSGRAFVYDLDGATPTTPVLALNDPDAGLFDYFGCAAAISGGRVIFGASQDDTGATDAGCAYSYDLDSVNPSSYVRLASTSPSGGDSFGAATAVSGTLMVVGAPGEGTGAAKAGSVYIYDRNASSLNTPVLTLHNPNPAPSALFGSAVSISGTRVAVGAYKSGRVYIYDTAAADPTVPVVTLNSTQSDLFGYAVAISGTRVAVGAYAHQTGGIASGSVFIYNLSSATPTVPVFTLNDPAGTANDEFGWSVALAGARLVVGAPLDDTGAQDAGRVYVYNLVAPTPTVPTGMLGSPHLKVNSELGTGGQFGTSVSISGTRIVVGAHVDSLGQYLTGGAFVYDVGTSPPALVFALRNPDPYSEGIFGTSVGISGTSVMVGMPKAYAAGVEYAGAAYLYDLIGSAPDSAVGFFDNPAPGRNDQFGSSVAIDGPLAIVGTPNDSTIAYLKGSAFVFAPLDADHDGLADAWEIARYGTSAGHNPQDDDDHDGLSDLLEEAFGTNPSKPDSTIAPAPVIVGGYLTMTLAKHPGVTYEVQTAATPDPAAFSAATTTVLVNDATTLKVRDNFLLGTTPGRFLRVKVTAAP